MTWIVSAKAPRKAGRWGRVGDEDWASRADGWRTEFALGPWCPTGTATHPSGQLCPGSRGGCSRSTLKAAAGKASADQPLGQGCPGWKPATTSSAALTETRGKVRKETHGATAGAPPLGAGRAAGEGSPCVHNFLRCIFF